MVGEGRRDKGREEGRKGMVKRRGREGKGREETEGKDRGLLLPYQL